MKMYKKLTLITLFLISSLNAEGLKEIIKYAIDNNNNIKAVELENQSKQKTYESVKNIYKPNVIIGGSYSKLDMDVRESQVGNTAVGFLKFGIDLYNGGREEALKAQKKYEYKEAIFSTVIRKKELALQVVTYFYQAKSIDENIKALIEKRITLTAELKRVKIKYDIKMITEDEVLKLQSEYEENEYDIQELEYQKTYMLKNLSLLTGKDIGQLDDSTLPEVQNLEFSDSENIKAMQENIKALEQNVNVVSSLKKLQLKLENSLNVYGYSDYNKQILKDLPKQQNQLMLTLTYNIFDTSSSEKKQAALLIKKAKDEQLYQLKKQEKINYELTKLKLQTQKAKIKSAKSALDMTNKLFEIIEIKYQNDVVDNITYLDALSAKVINRAIYKQSLYDYEIAKANYYFTSGINYEDVLSMDF
ncbi:MAG: TolC family protein [Sulfurimonas sp.]|nr:TolC family protein [Sulfurimonas sp.]